MVVWCTLLVMINYGGINFQAETAAKGKVISETKENYLVDFSEYANEKDYVGNYSRKLMNKDNCVGEK